MISNTELQVELKFRKLVRTIFHKPTMNSITELMHSKNIYLRNIFAYKTFKLTRY